MLFRSTRAADRRLAAVRLLICDVDGVLTRGDLLYGPGGEWKTFNVQDGHGFALARLAGLRTALLTARRSEVVRRRARELKVDLLLDGHRNKADGVRRILRRLDVPAAEACFLGDDLLVLGAFGEVGVPFAVANAVAEVKAAAAGVTARRGGEGAVRELLERIIKARGRWKAVLAQCREA